MPMGIFHSKWIDVAHIRTWNLSRLNHVGASSEKKQSRSKHQASIVFAELCIWSRKSDVFASRSSHVLCQYFGAIVISKLLRKKPIPTWNRIRDAASFARTSIIAALRVKLDCLNPRKSYVQSLFKNWAVLNLFETLDISWHFACPVIDAPVLLSVSTSSTAKTLEKYIKIL